VTSWLGAKRTSVGVAPGVQQCMETSRGPRRCAHGASDSRSLLWTVGLLCTDRVSAPLDDVLGRSANLPDGSLLDHAPDVLPDPDDRLGGEHCSHVCEHLFAVHRSRLLFTLSRSGRPPSRSLRTKSRPLRRAEGRWPTALRACERLR